PPGRDGQGGAVVANEAVLALDGGALPQRVVTGLVALACEAHGRSLRACRRASDEPPREANRIRMLSEGPPGRLATRFATCSKPVPIPGGLVQRAGATRRRV